MPKKLQLCDPSTCACEVNRYIKDIVDHLVIICDEIIDVPNTVSINLNDKGTCKMDNYYVLLTIFLLTVLLLEIFIIC